MNTNQANESFLILFQKVQNQLEKYCLALMNNRESALDLMSETIAIGLENFDKIKDKSKFKFYLFGIASNLLKQEIRKSALKKQYESTVNRNPETSMAYPGIEKDIELLFKAINKLPKAHAESLVMYELNEFKISEISELLKIPESTVKTHISRGRKQLIQLLNPEIKATQYSK